MIVGAIAVSVYGVVKVNEYQQLLREYDVCVSRVDRSVELNNFQTTLVDILQKDNPGEAAIAVDLRGALMVPISKVSCSSEPTFFTSFMDRG